MKKFLLSLASIAVAAFCANAAENIWLSGTPTPEEPYYAPNWSPITTYTFDVSADGADIVLPSATYERWQAQFGITNTFTLSAGKYYDFSCDIECNADFTGFVKIQENTVNETYLFDGEVAIKNGTIHLEKKGLEGVDISVPKLLFDFGGNPDNTTVKVTNITLTEGEAPVIPELGDNIWPSGNAQAQSVYFAPNWTESSNYSFEVGENNATITMDDATYGQWQAQFGIITTLALDPNKVYGFTCDVLSNNAVNVFFKLMQDGDDNTYILSANTAVEGGKKKSYGAYNLEGKDISALKLLLDFGGNPAGTTVRISKITLAEQVGTEAVDGIATDNNVEAEYYNLQGIRVNAPENGIYIVRRGNVVTKEMVRK